MIDLSQLTEQQITELELQIQKHKDKIMMDTEEYFRCMIMCYCGTEKNDTYPSHSHKWIVRTYTSEEFYRNFGTFETKEEAKEFIENYKVKYTTKGFITRYSIQGVCEVL